MRRLFLVASFGACRPLLSGSYSARILSEQSNLLKRDQRRGAQHEFTHRLVRGRLVSGAQVESSSNGRVLQE